MPVSQTLSRSGDAQQIVDAASAHAAAAGLRSLTLRDLAQAVDKSTTVIVNLFGSKSGLIQAVGEEAMRLDAAFHTHFFETVSGLPLNRENLLVLAQHYLRLRAEQDAGFARIWEALLLDSNTSPERRDLMIRWERLRQEA